MRNRQAYVTFCSQRLDLSSKNIFESAVVGNASQHAAISSQSDSRQRFSLLEEPVDQLSRDMLRIRGRAPLPNTKSFPLALRASAISCAARRTSAAWVSKKRRFTSRLVGNDG